jgi:hypothetical protein
MKIPITIAGNKYSIRPINKLTTSEFIELSKIENLDVVKYISWQTGVRMNDAFFAVTSKSIELAIGQVPDVSKIKRPKLKYVDYSKTIETVGQRHQIESSGLTGFELLVYCLAVAQARSVNVEDVNRLRDEYMSKPFIEVLPAGFFFFKTYRFGRSNALSFLKKLLLLIRTSNLKKMLVSKS